MAEEAKKGVLNEDWLAFWLAIILFLVSLLAYKGIDPFGWVISTNEWIQIEKALGPVGKNIRESKVKSPKLKVTNLPLKPRMERNRL